MSPIRGLTTNDAAFPRIGVLRKGGPKPDEKRPGPDLQYFRFTSEYHDVLEKFYQTFGQKPTDIPIVLPFRTRDENFENWQENWVSGGLRHRCDGDMCVVWLGQDGKYHHNPVKCPGGCKPVGRLTVVIPKFERLAYVTVLTTSINDILELNRNLAALEMALGDLRGIPLVLRRRPRMVSTPSGQGGKRARREKWLLTVEADEEWTKAQLAVQRRSAFLQLTAPIAELEAPDEDVDPITGEIINGTPWSTESFRAGEDPGNDDDDVEDGDFREIEDPAPSPSPAPEAPQTKKNSSKYKPSQIQKRIADTVALLQEAGCAYADGPAVWKAYKELHPELQAWLPADNDEFWSSVVEELAIKSDLSNDDPGETGDDSPF